MELLTIALILLGIGVAVGVGFLIDHLLSGKSTTCKKESDCSGTTPHCLSGKCVQCAGSSHCSGATPRCNNNVCVPALRCSEDSECKAGEECEDGKCVPIPCTATSGCTAPLVCKDGKCTLECSQNSQCQANEECKANRCVTKTCSDNSECAPPLKCKDGSCQLECTINGGECGPGKFCDRGVCENDLTCSKQSDCGVGELCSQGSCVRPCVDSGVCPPGSECMDGLCVRTRLPCPPGSTIVKGVCIKKPCAADGDCDGRKCVEGKCEPVCDGLNLSNPCGPSTMCWQGRCTLRYGSPGVCAFPFVQWPALMPPGSHQCVRYFISHDRRMPSKADPRFLMYEGNVDRETCQKMCISHQNCSTAFTNVDSNGQNVCTLWSRGVDQSLGTHATGQTHLRDFRTP